MNKKTTVLVALAGAFLLLVVIGSMFPYILDGQGEGVWERPRILTTTPTTRLVNETPWWTDMPTAPGLGRTPTATATPTPAPSVVDTPAP